MSASARPSKRLALHWQILIGLAAGLLVGAILNLAWSADTWLALGVHESGSWLAGTNVPNNADANAFASIARFCVRLNNFIGDLFIRCLRTISAPIVLFSLVVGASSLNDLKKLSRIGGKTVLIYVFTTAIAITVGLIFANLLSPGTLVDQSIRDELAAAGATDAQNQIASAQAPDTWDTLLNIVPLNPFEALAGANMLQIVFFALAVGMALTLIKKEKASVVITFCDAMTDVIIKLVNLVMLCAPYAVFALICRVVAQLGLEVLSALFVYSLTVIGGLAVMLFAIYPLILRLFTNVGYLRFFRAIAPAQLLAFSSSSSSATLPVTMKCGEERLGINEDVSAFALPLGSTINMDGTALYQGVASLFIAQLYGIELGLEQQITIVLTATLASIGTAGVPGVGLIMLVIVLQSVGMPTEVMAGGIAIIFGVDRILDMCRTTCNVTGDLMVSAVVAYSEGELLDEAAVARRSELLEQTPVDEHPHQHGADQYGIELGSTARNPSGKTDPQVHPGTANNDESKP